MKLPNWNRTHEFIKRLANLDNITFGFLAHKFGKDTHTAEAWARVPESHENPNGNGKRNPIDGGLRVIAIAHKEDAGLAREIAEISVDYCDYLDEQSGKAFIKSGGCVNELLAKSVKEHADIIVAVLSSTNPDYNKIYTECKQAQAVIAQIAACAKENVRVIVNSTYIERNAGVN